MDEKKLEGYKLKKLKSQFVYLRDVLQENQYIYDYFCRAKANEFNYSENLTFWSGSQYKIRHKDMQNNPQTYVTEVGLYDDNISLMAIGRLSAALEKNFSSEAIVKVRLTY